MLPGPHHRGPLTDDKEESNARMVLQARAYANAVPDQQFLYPSGQCALLFQVCAAHGWGGQLVKAEMSKLTFDKSDKLPIDLLVPLDILAFGHEHAHCPFEEFGARGGWNDRSHWRR